jgi:hypothetical protein
MLSHDLLRTVCSHLEFLPGEATARLFQLALHLVYATIQRRSVVDLALLMLAGIRFAAPSLLVGKN